MIVDSRTKVLNFGVAAGHLSFLFGHPDGRTYTSQTEAPLFVESELSAGVQCADIVGSSIYGNYYRRRCAGVAGHFEASQAISKQRYAVLQQAIRSQKTPARDYTHCGRYWTKLEELQFRRTDVPPPTGGAVVAGYYGFRELGTF